MKIPGSWAECAHLKLQAFLAGFSTGWSTDSMVHQRLLPHGYAASLHLDKRHIQSIYFTSAWLIQCPSANELGDRDNGVNVLYALAQKQAMSESEAPGDFC